MKVLHFTALEHPKVAMALQGQAWENLKPFRAYLSAAIRAADERRSRYSVTWKRAEARRTIRLTPCDTILELVPQDARYRVRGLPSGVDPRSLPPKLIINWSSLVDIRTIHAHNDDVLIDLDQPPPEGAQVAWAGNPITVEPAANVLVPTEVLDAAGRALPVVAVTKQGDATRLIVTGEPGTDLYARDGARILCRAVSWKEDLSEIRGQDGLRLPFTETLEVQVATLPTERLLAGNNSVRFSWEELKTRERRERGEWVQLLPLDEGETEVAVDPRAAFCEEGVREVRVEQRGGVGKNAIRVFGFRRDAWQLQLERLPPEGSTLQLPINTASLRRQREAVEQLGNGPLPHHRGLLQLLEDPAKTTWRRVRRKRVARWHLLNDPEPGQVMWDGTPEQREFVEKALGTEDFAFLEGPPGSGKTHAICELVLQLIEDNQRVLLCSSTHVAVDNVLERLVGRHPQVEALRIGAFERVDQRVRDCQIDARVDDLIDRWRQTDAFQGVPEEELHTIAEQVTLASVNLTCGTTTGILAHPYLRSAGHDRRGSSGRYPHFDVLILDEASKTTFQEFLVPALLARRWIVVGDVRQLPPFTERHDIEASLEELSDEQPGGGPRRTYSSAHQRACLLLFRLTSRAAQPGRLRWLLAEDQSVLHYLRDELIARAAVGSDATEGSEQPEPGSPAEPPWLPDVACIVKESASPPLPSASRAFYREVSLTDLEKGDPRALHLMAAHWVLVERDLLARCEPWLPADLCFASPVPKEMSAWPYRRTHWLTRHSRLEREVKERGQIFREVLDLTDHHQKFLRERSWANETAWRLSRVFQLSHARNPRERERLQRDLSLLMPARRPEREWSPAALLDLRDVGFRSLIDTLRLGRLDHRIRRRSALIEGMPKADWQERAVLLGYQHRMHPEISSFPRRFFYEDRALRDANTLEGRDVRVGWSFGTRYPVRRTWIDVDGREQRGINHDEIEAMRREIESWKAHCQKPRRDGRPWEIACLAFYNRQELGIRDMLREATAQPRRETRFELPHTEIVCATVDRFQGREADLVLLSLRNTARVGHLDSPNRLNVAITRARHLLLIFGRRSFYQECEIEELEELARITHSVKGVVHRR